MIRFADDTSAIDDGILRFQIGDIHVSVQSDTDEFLEDFGSLYSGCRAGRLSSDRTVRMKVTSRRRTALGRKRYVISGDGEELFTDLRKVEVLPYLEWGINWRLLTTRTDHLLLHAATLAHKGRGVILAGGSGFGKSTLAAGLVSRGWTYLCDEFALIDPGTLKLHPFPKAICIKAGSFDIVKGLGLPLWRRRHYVKAFKGAVGYIRPQDFAREKADAPCPIRYVIFPKYAKGNEPRLYPMAPGRAGFALAGHALNRAAFGEKAVSILSDVVRRAECYGLESGPIDSTCDLLESVVSAV